MIDNRPVNCRNRLQDEGKPYQKSGCDYCKNGGLMGCQFDKPNQRIKSQDEITEDRIRAIHSRIDVQRRIIASILSYSLNSMGFEQVMALLKMLEESQNPFDLTP